MIFHQEGRGLGGTVGSLNWTFGTPVSTRLIKYLVNVAVNATFTNKNVAEL